MLNILCPYRNRQRFYADFIQHFRQRIPNANIYMLEQCDNTLFKRGQLLNVAFNNIPLSDNCMFIDVDIRLQGDIDFEKLLLQNNTVVIPYDILLLYRLSLANRYVPEHQKSYFIDAPDGGVTLFTKSIFSKCNGFSNLYIGWGREDSDFVRRNTNNITRVKNTMIHLTHERHKEWTTPAFKRNDNNFKIPTDMHLDGFKQTTADFSMSQLDNKTFHCKISNISVIKNYVYEERIIKC